MKLQVVKYDELLEAFAWTVKCSLFLRSTPISSSLGRLG